MKNISKKDYVRLKELYYGAKWLDNYLKAIEDAEYRVVGLVEVHNPYGDWVYLWLSKYDPKWHTEMESERLYLSFGGDSRTIFYVGEAKEMVGYSRFDPEGITEYLKLWTRMKELCSNYC